MFESFFARFAQVIPRVKADDEDLIDPQQVLRQENIHNNEKIKLQPVACTPDKNGNGNGGDDDGNELVDPIEAAREKCRAKKHAVALAQKYEDCNARVLSKSQTSETCVEELFDLLHAIDHCVTEKLFAQLK